MNNQIYAAEKNLEVNQEKSKKTNTKPSRPLQSKLKHLVKGNTGIYKGFEFQISFKKLLKRDSAAEKETKYNRISWYISYICKRNSHYISLDSK